MICITNAGGGGGGSSAWAYIAVTYPAGSTCTATNGTTTLTAQGTSGLYVFQIPQPATTPETWTVTCTDGTRTRNAQAEISAQYQNVVISLSYSRLPDGYQEVEYIESPSTGGYFNQSLNAPSINEQIEIDFMMLENLEHSVFGMSYGMQPNFGLCVAAAAHSAFGYYWRGGFTASTASIGRKTSAVINNSNHAIIENDTQISTGALSGDHANYKYVLGGMYDFAGGYGVTGTGKTRFYKYIRTNLSTDTVLQNFVPCYRTSDMKIGFYDIANSEFLLPSGSGTWAKGADV